MSQSKSDALQNMPSIYPFNLLIRYEYNKKNIVKYEVAAKPWADK